MKSSKKMLKWGMLFILFGLIMITIGLLLDGKKYVVQADLNSLNWQQQTAIPGEVIVEKEPLADFLAVDAQLAWADIAIEPSDNEQAFISYHIMNQDNRGQIGYQVENSQLTIQQGTPTNHLVTIDLSFIRYLFDSEIVKGAQETQLTLYLPKKTYKRIAVNNEVGGITIRNLIAEEANLQSSTGVINLTNSQILNVTLQNSLGNLHVAQSEWQVGNLSTDLGLIDLQQVKAKNSSIQSNLGGITLTDSVFEDSIFKTDTGDIQSEATDFTGETEVTTDLGKLSFEFKEERLATTNFTLISDLGRITTPTQLDTREKNRPDSFHVKSDTGSITIK